ncbi:MAG: YdcF family protein [Thermomicrobiales bacterium]
MRSGDETSRIPTYTTWPAPTGGAASSPALRGSARTFRRGLWAEAWRWALTGSLFAVVAAGLLGLSLFAAIYWQVRSEQSGRVNTIVVFGAAQYNGAPSPVLEARLDEALAAYHEGVAPLIVVTGGRQSGDRFTEAESGRDYLTAHGVPRSAIALENRGTDSWESLQGAATLLRKRSLGRVLLVSDGFHLFRVKAMARYLGLIPTARPAVQSPIKQDSRDEIDYMVREEAALLKFLWDRHGL